MIAMSLSEKLALNKLMTDFVFNKSEEVIARFEENNYVTIHRDQGQIDYYKLIDGFHFSIFVLHATFHR